MNVVVLGELCEDILMHNPNSVEIGRASCRERV